MKRGILIRTIVEGIDQAEVIEDYPTYHAGPAVLLLQRDPSGEALHVVWGIETGTEEPAVLVTAYRPNPADWSSDFRSRMK